MPSGISRLFDRSFQRNCAPLLDTEGFYLLAWLTPHQQRLVRAVAFRFARRRPVLPCIMSLHNSIHTKIQHNAIYIFIPAYF